MKNVSFIFIFHGKIIENVMVLKLDFKTLAK
jgi:hypothetical protein